MNLWLLGSEGHRNSGVFKYSSSLIKGLRARGHSIDEVSFRENFFYIKKYLFLPMFSIIYSIFRKYDRVILPDESYAFLIVFLFGFKDKCIVVHDYRKFSRKTSRELFKSMLMGVNYRMLGMFDKIICVSEFTKKTVLKELPFIKEGKVRVIYNAVEFPFVSEEKKKSASEGFFDFIYIGSHEPRKNTLKILEAFSAFESECHSTNVRLLVVGRPIDSKIYTEFKEKAKSYKNVICYDEVDESLLIDLITSSSCFICASDFEGFGRTPVEAQYFEVPVISTSAAALQEVLPTGTKIEISVPVSSKAICDAMWTCYNLTPQERTNLIQNAKLNVDRFKPETSVQNFEALVLNEKTVSFNS